MGGWMHGFMVEAGDDAERRNMLDQAAFKERFDSTTKALQDLADSPDTPWEERPRLYNRLAALKAKGIKAKDKDLDISDVFLSSLKRSPKPAVMDYNRVQADEKPQYPSDSDQPFPVGTPKFTRQGIPSMYEKEPESYLQYQTQEIPGYQGSTQYTPYEQAMMEIEKQTNLVNSTAAGKAAAKGTGANKQILTGTYLGKDLKAFVKGTPQENDPFIMRLDDNSPYKAGKDSATSRWEVSPEIAVGSVAGGKYIHPVTGQYAPARLNRITNQLSFPDFQDYEGIPTPIPTNLRWELYPASQNGVFYKVGYELDRPVAAIPTTPSANIAGRTTQRESHLDIGGDKVPIVYTSVSTPNSVNQPGAPGLPVQPYNPTVQPPVPPVQPTAQPGLPLPPVPSGPIMNTGIPVTGLDPNRATNSAEAISQGTSPTGGLGGMIANMGGILGLPQVAKEAVANIKNWDTGRPLLVDPTTVSNVTKRTLKNGIEVVESVNVKMGSNETPVTLTDAKGNLKAGVAKSTSAKFTPTRLTFTDPRIAKAVNSMGGIKGNLPGFRKTQARLTQQQSEKLHQNEGTTRQSLERVYRAYQHIDKLSNWIVAGKIQLALDPRTATQLIVRAVGMTDEEAEIASDFISLTEDIQKMREPMGAAGFRSLEAFMALQRQRGTPMGHKMLTQNVLKNTMKVFLTLRGTAVNALDKDSSEGQNIADVETAKMYRTSYGTFNAKGELTNPDVVKKVMQLDGWRWE